MKKIYIASPLFNDSEIAYNKKIKQLLSSYFQVFLPQDDAGKIVDLVKGGMKIELAGRKMFDDDLKAMKESDIILIILDGRVIDEGAAFELGYMFAQKKECYGFQTDIRKPYLTGNNPMITYSCKKIFKDTKELLGWAKDYNKS